MDDAAVQDDTPRDSVDADGSALSGDDPVRPGSGTRVDSARTTLRAILAEFALDRTTGLPLTAVVECMTTAGCSAEAARQAVSRAGRSGALVVGARARRGEVLLEESARASLRLAAAATAESSASAEPWDGTWTLVLLRGTGGSRHPHRVRSALLLEGLGSLGNGVWVTPHTLRSERLIALLHEDPDLNLAVCQATFDYPSDGDIAEQAWDLTALRAEYDGFLSSVSALVPRTDADRFSAWITLARRWHHVARTDPGIPDAAIGPDWPADEARRLVQDRRSAWRAGAQRHFDSIVTRSQK